MSTIITAIDRHSPAERAGVQVGEQLLSINGHPIVDVLDYRFYGYDPLSHLELKTAAAPFMTYLLEQAKAYFPALRGQVIAVENDFFGHTIDVAGLLTGQDLSAQLQKVPDLGRVLLPLHMLRHGENVFLDDYTVERLSAELGYPVQIVGIDGGDLLDAMLEREG